MRLRALMASPSKVLFVDGGGGGILVPHWELEEFLLCRQGDKDVAYIWKTVSAVY